MLIHVNGNAASVPSTAALRIWLRRSARMYAFTIMRVKTPDDTHKMAVELCGDVAVMRTTPASRLTIRYGYLCSLDMSLHPSRSIARSFSAQRVERRRDGGPARALALERVAREESEHEPSEGEDAGGEDCVADDTQPPKR